MWCAKPRTWRSGAWFCAETREFLFWKTFRLTPVPTYPPVQWVPRFFTGASSWLLRLRPVQRLSMNKAILLQDPFVAYSGLLCLHLYYLSKNEILTGIVWPIFFNLAKCFVLWDGYICYFCFLCLLFTSMLPVRRNLMWAMESISISDYQCHCSTIPVVVVGISLPVGPLEWYFLYTDGIRVCVIIFHMKT